MKTQTMRCCKGIDFHADDCPTLRQPAPRGRKKATVESKLQVIYEQWMAEQRIPLMSAADALATQTLTKAQYTWLNSFISLWCANANTAFLATHAKQAR